MFVGGGWGSTPRCTEYSYNFLQCSLCVGFKYYCNPVFLQVLSYGKSKKYDFLSPMVFAFFSIMQTLAQDPPANPRRVLLRPSFFPGIFKCEFWLHVFIYRFPSLSLSLYVCVSIYIYIYISLSLSLSLNLSLSLSLSLSLAHLWQFRCHCQCPHHNFGKNNFKHYAGSGLPQGPFWKTISPPLKVGSRLGFCQCPEIGKVGL